MAVWPQHPKPIPYDRSVEIRSECLRRTMAARCKIYVYPK
jgi:hypothetical protein